MQARTAICTALDFETTGSVPGYRNEPWQLGLIEIHAGELAADSAFDSLLRVGKRPFNPHAPGRHGERRMEIAAAPTLTCLWPRLQPVLTGRPLVAHNASTERRMLGDTFPMHRFGPWIDTLALARYTFPGLASYSLEQVVGHLGLTANVDALCPGRTWHDAFYDAVAGACLLQHVLHLPGWESVTVETLASIRTR